MSTANRTSPGFGRATRLARPVAVAALCAAVVAASPAPAQAQTVTDADAAGDMTAVTDESLDPAPERTLNDITSTTLTHTATRVAIDLEYADLQKVGYQSLYVEMVTNEGVRRHLSVDAYRRHWSGQTFMHGPRRVIRCDIDRSIDYEADVVSVSFPRRCASSPRWIRFRVGAVMDDFDVVYIDDALRDRPINEHDNNWALSGRVYRDAA